MDSAALYYPFHLCSRETLEHLLSRYAFLHFRDYMALQLTSMSGTMAYLDRISDHYPDLYAQGRIVQGHQAGGPISAELARRIDADLADHNWREIFHSALHDLPRFRRGFDERGQDATYFAPYLAEQRATCPMSLAEVREMSGRKLDAESSLAFEYGMMLVKTSAALWYTIQLCKHHTLEAATDSPAHDQLLKCILTRDGLQLSTYLWQHQPASP